MKRNRSATKVRKRRPSTQPPAHELPAATFKARCLELMDRVRETGAEYVVTKHGMPVARLAPCRGQARPAFLGCLEGTLVAYRRPFDPIPGPWSMERGALVDSDE